MKKFLFLFALMTVCSVNFSAQNPVSKTIEGGVVNGKANILARPKYPAAARAVKAGGSVSVQVLIDEEGTVISAKPVSGHPLLYSESVKAAFESKFSPTLIDRKPVKVSGIITYNFVDSVKIKTLSEIGFELGILEKAEVPPSNISINEISDNLPSEWTEEKGKLFDFYKKPEPLPTETKKQVALKAEPAKNKSKNSDWSPVGLSVGLRVVPSTSAISATPKEFSPERPQISAELIGMIEKRLETDSDRLWKFKAGAVLGRVAAQNNDETKLKAESSNLSKLIATAPNGLSALTMENMGKLLVMIQSDNITEERKAEIKTLANSLKLL